MSVKGFASQMLSLLIAGQFDVYPCTHLIFDFFLEEKKHKPHLEVVVTNLASGQTLTKVSVNLFYTLKRNG